MNINSRDLRTVMANKDIRRQFGQRVKALRKLKRWTQQDLADKIDVRSPQLNKYEGGVHAPPMEKLIELAEVLDTTVDYLLTGDREGQRPLHNVRLMERFKALERFEAEDQEAVIKLIDAMIVKNQVKGVMDRMGGKD